MAIAPRISVITVTLNCAQHLQRLIATLLAQTDQDFDWIVIDGGSTDGTQDVATRFPSTRSTISSGPDFGIYDALNKGVALTQGDYYLVVGADDELHPQAIANYRKVAAETQWDIVAAQVECNGSVLQPMRGSRWLRGGNAFVASHAVGALIRRRLHDTCGLYSKRYVNAADMHFILSAVTKAQARVGAGEFIAGRFGADGISTTDHICSVSEAFRIQLAFGESKALQFALFTGRLMRALWLQA
jgi:glycosyltransferase involved in cell wall biosynthesis